MNEQIIIVLRQKPARKNSVELPEIGLVYFVSIYYR